MPVLYCISYSCKVRKKVSDENLLAMLEARNQADYAIRMMEDDQESKVDRILSKKDYSKWKFLFCKIEPTGASLVDTSVGYFLKIAKPLEKLEIHCADCPKDIEKNAFGCCGTLSIPVRRTVEEWLMRHLPEDIHLPPGKLLQDIITKGSFTGKRVESIRAKRVEYINRTMYDDAGVFELDYPITRHWTGGKSEVQINSSQVWEMLVCNGNYDTTYAKNIAQIFGYLDNEMNLTQDTDRVPQEEDPSNIWGLKRFFYLVAQAAKENLGLVIVEPAIPKEI